jgi:dTDP-4-amino-4,6-dideoxygalactose transaminase
MYVSAWPGLTPRDILSRRRGVLEAAPYPLNAQNRSSFFVARGGIYHLIQALELQPGEVVLAPDYHSGTEVAAIRAAGASIAFYPVQRNLELDLEALHRLARQFPPRVLYVIHYLGWPQPMAEIEAFCARYGSILIEDCALAMLSAAGNRPLGTFGDYSIFCLYKSLPVPNGGLLVQNRQVLPKLAGLKLEPCPRAATAGRSAELALEALRSRFDATGKALFRFKQAIGRRMRSSGVEHLPVGDTSWNPANVNLAMSRVSDRVMKGLDYEEIRWRRRNNFNLLKERLDGRVTMPRGELSDGVCPLFFPLLVREKYATAEALRRKGIEAVEFWNDSLDRPAIGPDASYLRTHLLELPIHQDVTKTQVEYIAAEVLRLKPEPAPC